MNIGRVQLTLELVEQALQLPDGHHVQHIVAQNANELANRRFSVIVEGPLMPTHLEGSEVMMVDAPRRYDGGSEEEQTDTLRDLAAPLGSFY